MTPILAQRPRSDRAFERLYQRYVGDVYRYALVVLRNPDDAEDVTQTTFMNAYRAFARGERPRTPQNWLIAIAHNVCRQRFRQAARRPNELPLEDDIADGLADEEAGPTADDIRRALGHLAFNQRAALVMRELEGRSYQEIADVLGLSTSAVETLIFRARRALREQLEGSLTCTEAELAISRQLDGRLGRKEKGQLRAHLRECEDCARFARSQRAQRSAIQSLALIPVPSSLSSFFGQHAAATGAGAGAAAAGTGVAAKVALVGASAIVATGVGVETAHKAGWHPLRHSHSALAAHVAKPTPPPSASSARSGAVADGAAVLPPALARGQTRAQKPTHVGGPSDVPAPPHVAKGPKGTPPGLARKIPKIVSSHGRAPAVARARHSARPSKPVASSHRSTATRHRAAPAHRPHGSPAVKLNPPPPHKHGSTATILNPPAPPDDSGSHGHQK